MKEFEINHYIELYNHYEDRYLPVEDRYLPVRVLKKNIDWYSVKFISTEKEINIHESKLKKYGYRELWISKELLKLLDFKINGHKNQIDSLIVWECLIGEQNNNSNDHFIYEYRSKFLGYAFLRENSLDEFIKDFAKLDYNSDSAEFEKKYLISSSANELFSHLKEINPMKYSIENIDRIVKEYRNI